MIFQKHMIQISSSLNKVSTNNFIYLYSQVNPGNFYSSMREHKTSLLMQYVLNGDIDIWYWALNKAPFWECVFLYFG